MNHKEHDIIAIDIAKGTLQVQTVEQCSNILNNKIGFKHLYKLISKLKNPFVVCEATGGYERKLMEMLHSKNVPVALVNPGLVRAFARSEGIKAKTDPIDGKVILRFAQEKKLRPTPPPDPTRRELADLMDRRSQLTEQIAREKNRKQKSIKSIDKSIERMIRFINKELASIEARIRKLINSKPIIKEQVDVMQLTCGIGEITAWTLMAYLEEIGTLGRNQLVALAGVAPYNNDSGAKSGKRSIYAGRAKVRKCLYMAAQTAAQHNPVIKPYVDGLIARGKPYKCAMVAAMRKLLIHLQSQIKNIEIEIAS